MSALRGATVYQLGSLLPEQENPLKDMLGQIDALEQEALGDIRTVADEGHSVTAFKSQLDAYSAQGAILAGEFTTLDEGHIAGWKGRANAVIVGLMDLMTQLGKAKQGGFELAGEKGLLWGLGVGLGVATIALVVWRGKKRRRRFR